MANNYSISGHELRLDETGESIEVWALANEETEPEEVFYIGPDNEGLKIWCGGGDFYVETSNDTTLGDEYPLDTWTFKHTVDGGILTIDIRDPDSTLSPPPDVSYPLGDVGSYMILRINSDDDLLVYYHDPNSNQP